MLASIQDQVERLGHVTASALQVGIRRTNPRGILTGYSLAEKHLAKRKRESWTQLLSGVVGSLS